MSNAIQPFHLLVIALADWLNRHQQDVIDYLIEENRVLRAAENNNYPIIAPDFCSDSRCGKGRIIALCNPSRNTEAGPKDKKNWMIICFRGPYVQMWNIKRRGLHALSR